MINDYDTIVDFGKHKGKKIKELPRDYVEWCLKNVSNKPTVTDAMIRIASRVGVTALIRGRKCPSYIPILHETTMKFVPIHREPSLCPSLFGTFVEYAYKHFNRISIDDEPVTLLAQHGLEQFPPHLIWNGKFDVPTRRIMWIHESFKKQQRSVADICNLSFSHQLQMGSLNENRASDLFRYVNENAPYFESYFRSLGLPIPDDELQHTCDKISVGCVIGVIDLISNGAIVDIKCRQADNTEEYRMQLYSYAALHYLRYGPLITRCEIYNFLTGKCFVMPLNDLQNHAKEFISDLGSYCKEHVKLLNSKSV